jgi:hypothetical protein
MSQCCAQLYVDYDVLQSDQGSSAAAYVALRRASLLGTTVLLGGSRGRTELRRLTGQDRTPVVITGDGEVYSTLPAILEWAERAA